MSESFLNGRVMLHAGDCMDVLPCLEENSVDSGVCDPPYHLTSIVKRFGADNAAPCKVGKTGAYARASSGFMGKQWDGGDIAFRPETWAAVYRVLKPGAHLIAFGGTRTYHRMACAIEDAGFEIRDQIQWLYGSGFPKSHDVSKGIDRSAGAEREVIGPKRSPDGKPMINRRPNNFQGEHEGWDRPWKHDREKVELQASETAPATDAARQWQGWGTALKPACEPIVLARKPLSESTVAANVLKWGTGALNIDGCRVGVDGGCAGAGAGAGAFIYGDGLNGTFAKPIPGLGRWPANVIHDGSEEVVGAFPAETGKSAGGNSTSTGNPTVQFVGADESRRGVPCGFGDSGSAARFFYTSKADADDRLGSKHPTVKPLDLMQYLVRLVTPPKGIVLDCFAGTGTTGEAAWREGFNAVLIEREEEYQSDIRRRMALCLSGPDERGRESIKARHKDKPVDHGPLFA
jgi:site-specific DNA-methyltransferase (adenine-specific)